MPTLQDRIVWITGAGSGIGRAIAIGFAAAGARVALTGRRVDPLAQTASEIGQAAIVVPADVTNADQVAEAYETVNKAWGAVDVLVNNAGRNSSKRHMLQLTVAEMSSLLDVNLKTAFLCSMVVLPAMRARKTGTLIHIGSMAATMVFPYCGCHVCRSEVGCATHERAYQCRGRYSRHSVNLYQPWRGCDRDIGRTPQPTDAGRTSTDAASRGYRHGCLIRRRIAAARHCLRYDNRADGQPSLAILCARDHKRIGSRTGMADQATCERGERVFP